MPCVSCSLRKTRPRAPEKGAVALVPVLPVAQACEGQAARFELGHDRTHEGGLPPFAVPMNLVVEDEVDVLRRRRVVGPLLQVHAREPDGTARAVGFLEDRPGPRGRDEIGEETGVLHECGSQLRMVEQAWPQDRRVGQLPVAEHVRVAGDAHGVGGVGARHPVRVDEHPITEAIERPPEEAKGHLEAAHPLAAPQRVVGLAQGAAQAPVVREQGVLLDVLEEEQHRAVPVQLQRLALPPSHCARPSPRRREDCRSVVPGQRGGAARAGVRS